MSKKTAGYGNDSITMLKGADKVRKRPAVIFGSVQDISKNNKKRLNDVRIIQASL